MQKVFTDTLRLSLVNAKHWSERQLEALCCGVPPGKYGDRQDILKARAEISAAIKSGALRAQPNHDANAAEQLYGGMWLIEPARAIRWALPQFPTFPNWLEGSKLRERWTIEEAEKKADGRFTLSEAAALIARDGSEDEKIICEKLRRAVERKELLTYEPGKNIKVEYDQNTGQKKPVRGFYEECFWDDLNKWLDGNESRVSYRFTAPKAVASTLAPLASTELDKEDPLAPCEVAPSIKTLAPQPDEIGLSKREKQIRAIVATAEAQGYSVLSIKTGNKALLRKMCKKLRPDLFGAGDSPFNDAWADAIGRNPPRLQMTDHNKFAGR